MRHRATELQNVWVFKRELAVEILNKQESITSKSGFFLLEI